jgi:acyl-CoA thioester hydrolase
MPHRTLCRIYYEDTDAGGIVYYANYLNFAERARTEWLRDLGFDQSRLLGDSGIMIIVRHCSVDYLAPARLDDVITVETRLQEIGKVRMTMQQEIRRESKALVQLTVMLACVNAQGRPVRWPPSLLRAMQQ